MGQYGKVNWSAQTLSALTQRLDQPAHPHLSDPCFILLDLSIISRFHSASVPFIFILDYLCRIVCFANLKMCRFPFVSSPQATPPSDKTNFGLTNYKSSLRTSRNDNRRPALSLSSKATATRSAPTRTTRRSTTRSL